ncbi:hypothetical protein EW026_g3632 [Hermanssonia centrifuga]|uniref:Ribosomal protein S2 n=1 Tax=Hermanssonia centrifuga TaxID=98765 RepID=A0A4S4KP86_9APHY|nr:hypothetical protein EW026_g3632 [Hermanssonia centrifuga]
MNTNFTPYAYGVRAGITVIDLDTTLPLLRRAAQVVRAIAAKDGSIVFVGTRPDLRSTVRKAAERLEGQGYHVGEKWLPGTLTNRLSMYSSDVNKERRVIPDLVIFLNPVANMHAIRECAIEHIPTIGIVDSNVDPRIVIVAGREGVALKREEEQRIKGKARAAAKFLQRAREQADVSL